MKINLKEIILLPNLISFFRLLLFIPFLILFNLASKDWSYRHYIFYTIILAFFTDLLDGFVARKTNKISELGKLIDPLADKLLMTIIVLNLFFLGKIPGYFLFIILLRDLLIFVGGIILSRKLNKILPSNLLGKLTVFLIGIFILSVLLDLDSNAVLYRLLLITSLIMSVASIIGYAIRASEFLKKTKSPNVIKD